LIKGKKPQIQVSGANDRISPDIDPSLRGSPEMIHIADNEVEKVTK
jgi:hypothetical protein